MYVRDNDKLSSVYKEEDMIKEFLKKMIPDSIYLRIIFKINMGYKLDLNNPKTFNEKLQWLKLHDRNPYYTKLVDKYEVKKIVAELIGEEYIIPTYGIWEKFEEINFDKLPQQFVLKCTHDSGGLFIVRDKEKFDMGNAGEQMKVFLKRNYYYAGREWPYKNIKPRILAEKYLEESSKIKVDSDLTDYKFYCFDGHAECVLICTGRETGIPNYYYFDRDWNFLKYDKKTGELPNDFKLPKPKSIDKMFELAEKLSSGIKHVRVDFYEVNKKIYFGELTFYTSGGLDTEITKEADMYLGSLLKL